MVARFVIAFAKLTAAIVAGVVGIIVLTQGEHQITYIALMIVVLILAVKLR